MFLVIYRYNRRCEAQLRGAVHEEPAQRSPICRHHTRLQSDLRWFCPRKPPQVPLPRHPQGRGLRAALQQSAKQRQGHKPSPLCAVFRARFVCVLVDKFVDYIINLTHVSCLISSISIHTIYPDPHLTVEVSLLHETIVQLIWHLFFCWTNLALSIWGIKVDYVTLFVLSVQPTVSIMVYVW